MKASTLVIGTKYTITVEIANAKPLVFSGVFQGVQSGFVMFESASGLSRGWPMSQLDMTVTITPVVETVDLVAFTEEVEAEESKGEKIVSKARNEVMPIIEKIVKEHACSGSGLSVEYYLKIQDLVVAMMWDGVEFTEENIMSLVDEGDKEFEKSPKNANELFEVLLYVI